MLSALDEIFGVFSWEGLYMESPSLEVFTNVLMVTTVLVLLDS